jgi:drug/metabolite transporter (DMT)-like permease
LTPEKWKAAAITLVAVLAVSLGETLLSKGMKETTGTSATQEALSIITNRYVIVGTILMALYFGCYMAALKLAPFSFVLPLTALSFITGGALAQFYLHENVTPLKWAGYLVITLGVVVVGLAEAAPR